MNNVNLKGCAFSADIVPYMYGELVTFESNAFESHLLECEECTEEFAAVSSARFEVYDWKKLEFDPLRTPAFEIPHAQPAYAGQATWIEKLRAAVSRPWAVPGAAFAAIALFSVMAASFYFKGDDGQAVAKNDAETPPTVARPEIRLPEVESPKAVSGENTEPKRHIVKAASGPTAAPRRPVRRVETVQPKVAAVQQVRTNAPALRLNEFNDDEDTSLRLAQLFDDVDTRD
ncbi:MAG TPA: hypothetical protein VNA22_08715 [Pyrinomonadaceae bacterium]|nr:hypothetical protein [Pyrinomonadaceae bacterium]